MEERNMKKNYNCPVVMVTAIHAKSYMAGQASMTMTMSSGTTVNQSQVDTEGFLLGKERDESESTGWSDGLW